MIFKRCLCLLFFHCTQPKQTTQRTSVQRKIAPRRPILRQKSRPARARARPTCRKPATSRLRQASLRLAPCKRGRLAMPFAVSLFLDCPRFAARRIARDHAVHRSTVSAVSVAHVNPCVTHGPPPPPASYRQRRIREAKPRLVRVSHLPCLSSDLSLPALM